MVYVQFGQTVVPRKRQKLPTCTCNKLQVPKLLKLSDRFLAKHGW